MHWFIFLFSLTLFSVDVIAAEKRNQLEELFIWKTSDELRLSATEEKKFSEFIKKLNKEKSNLNQALQDSIEKMSKLKTVKSQDVELKNYRGLLQSYAKLSEKELDQVKTLLGTERLVRYLVIKQELANKIKTLLSSEGANQGNKNLPPPKLIEEK